MIDINEKLLSALDSIADSLHPDQEKGLSYYLREMSWSLNGIDKTLEKIYEALVVHNEQH